MLFVLYSIIGYYGYYFIIVHTLHIISHEIVGPENKAIFYVIYF